MKIPSAPVLCLAFAAFFAASAFAVPADRKPVHLPKVEKTLLKKDLRFDDAILSRMDPAAAYAKFVLRVESEPDSEELASLGILKLFGRPPFVSVLVPVTNLGRLSAGLTGLLRVLPPLSPHPDSIPGEEVDLMQASNFTRLGFDGAGVKVAVIDGGFYRLSEAIASGDLPSSCVKVKYSQWPTIDYDSGEGSEHGTAVAEVVHEIAPAATIYLIRIDDVSSLLKAMDYCAEEKIRIINHSMGWFLDGWTESEGEIGRYIVGPAFRTNILWVNSAGNSAVNHYQAVFSDSDLDGRHNFGPAQNRCIVSNAFAGDVISLYLDWAGFSDFYDGNGSFANYDITLYNRFNTPVASSLSYQPTAGPWETISYTVQAFEQGNFSFEIARAGYTRNYEFQVFSADHQLSPSVAASSLLAPADSSFALAVGAIASSNWLLPAGSMQAEYYSSCGPTKTGRIKPDLCGIDNMTNFIYGRFPGTSAASPSVAGLAALILSKQPYLHSDQLYWTLRDNAEDVGPAGQDNTFGAGKARLDLFPVRRNTDRVRDNIIVAPTRLSSDRRVFYYGISDETRIRLLTLDGMALKEFEPLTGSYATGANFIDLAGIALPDGVYLLEFSTPGNVNAFRKIIVTR